MGECNTIPSIYTVYGIAHTHQFADDKLNVAYLMGFSFPNFESTVEKGEMLVTGIFSFSYSAFKGLKILMQCHENLGLCDKGFIFIVKRFKILCIHIFSHRFAPLLFLVCIYSFIFVRYIHVS